LAAADTPATGESDDGGDGGGPIGPRDDGEDTPAVPAPGTPSDPTGTPPANGPGGDGGGDGGGIPLPGGGDLLPPSDVTSVDGLADGLESTTTFLGHDVVSPLSPGLGELLTTTGQGLTDLVRALDGTPPPPR
jgi:hypothetical protein